MDLLPVEPISKELELSETEIIKNRCELIESQLKMLQKMLDDSTAENKQMRVLIYQLYNIIESYSENETDDEIEPTTAIPIDSYKTLSIETKDE
jgi:hypothetical protein